MLRVSSGYSKHDSGLFFKESDYQIARSLKPEQYTITDTYV